VQTGIDLRVPLLRLRYAEQVVHFRKQAFERPAVSQYLEIHPGIFTAQSLFGFTPRTIRNQCIDFTGFHHAAHQCHRLARDFETQAGKPGGELCHPKNSNRVFAEGVRHVTKGLVLDVLQSAVGIDQLAIVIFGDRIDGQIATRKIIFQRNVRRKVEREAVIAGRCFSLGSGEGVFFF